MIVKDAPASELLAEEWAVRRAAFESTCRCGSGRTPDPETVIGELARAFEQAARRELLAIRDAYFRPSAQTALEPNEIVNNRTLAETRNRQPDATPRSESELPTFMLPPVKAANPGADGDGTVTLRTPNGMTSTFELSPQEPWPGRLPNVPGYLLLSVLGHGGMGVVYKAKHLALNREVALKMILRGDHASPSAISRFLTEARSVARINHPNIVQIYQIDEHDGLPSFALEFCPGGGLDRKLNKEPLPPLKAAAYAESLAGALQAVHHVGVIHRDIKPSNILVAADGSLKITDFGLARAAVDDGGQQTGSGTILGSPSYMPPEQATGKQDAVGPLSDQYSLGATLYEFLTGSPPFKGPTTLDTIQQVIDKEPVPPSTLQPGVPKDLETICLKALSKDPTKRYASTAAMAADLKAFREGRPIAARPVGRIEKGWRWAKRNPRVAGLLAAVASLLVVLAVGGASFTAVYREKAAEAEANFHESEIRGVQLAAKAIEAQNNFREAESRGVQLAAALHEAEANLKEANENYGLARDLSIALTQRVPGEIRSRVLDPNARLSVVDLIVRTILDRKPGGSVRQLPDRILYAATLLRGDAALDRGDARAALADYIAGTAIAERMVATEPKEKDKAYGLWAVSLESQASAQLILAKARANTNEAVEAAKAAAEAGKALAEKAVAAQRDRVASPRSPELPLLERKQNLANALAKLANFIPLQDAEKLLDEAIALQNEVVNGDVSEGTRQARLNLANLLHQQAEAFYQQQKRKERGESLGKAIVELTKHQAEVPENLAVRVTLAQWNRERGDMIIFDGDRAAALPYYRTVYELTRPLMTGKKTLLLQEELAADAYRAGTAALETKDAAAVKHFRSCFRLAEETMESGRVTTQLLGLASLAAARSGELRHAENYAAKVEGLAKNNISQLMEAACCYATILGCIDTAADAAHLTATEKATKKAATTVKVIEMIAKRLEVLKSPKYAGGWEVNLANYLRRLNTDPDFDGVRETPEFRKFVEDVRAMAP